MKGYYRAKKVFAVEWTGNKKEIKESFENGGYVFKDDDLYIITPKGEKKVELGNIVIHEILTGRLFALKNTTFEKLYEKIKE